VILIRGKFEVYVFFYISIERISGIQGVISQPGIANIAVIA
jgi:hypothetical protein